MRAGGSGTHLRSTAWRVSCLCMYVHSLSKVPHTFIHSRRAHSLTLSCSHSHLESHSQRELLAGCQCASQPRVRLVFFVTLSTSACALSHHSRRYSQQTSFHASMSLLHTHNAHNAGHESTCTCDYAHSLEHVLSVRHKHTHMNPQIHSACAQTRLPLLFTCLSRVACPAARLPLA
jgi:hypothetical protein